MAKENKRGNRETKKPKQTKAAPAPTPAFDKGSSTMLSQIGKKKT